MRPSQHLQSKHLEAMLKNKCCLTELNECVEMIIITASTVTTYTSPMQYSHVGLDEALSILMAPSSENSNSHCHYVQCGRLEINAF